MLTSFSRTLFYRLPPKFRFLARRLIFLPIDFFEKITGRRPPMVPPRGLIFTGSGDFVKSGNELVRRFVELGGLKPDDRFLDVGCGIGRVAIPLTRFLNENGRYEGFDPIELGVRFCRKTITPHYPNFNFQYTPLKNDLYRNSGASASKFRFPFDENVFDFICVNSVFTHMVESEMLNYLDEISRVLRPGGVCYASFFLLDDEARRTMEPVFSFPFKVGNHFLMDEKVESANVAFEADWLANELIMRGLKTLEKWPGFWPGREPKKHLDFQDVLLISK